MGTVPETPSGPSPSARSAPTSPRQEPPSLAIEISEVDVYYGQRPAVRNASVDMAAASVVAMIGPNGSGKSSLLSTISGLVPPTRGRILVQGRPPKSQHARVAHVLQATIANQALPLTVLEAVRMGCYARAGLLRRLTADDRAAVADAVERMQLGDLQKRHLHELSGGQRQRTYVAQGLAQRADVLLLDEPITGLDLVTQQTITRMMDDERAAGRTVVVTTHDVGTARRADQVVLLATDVVACGPPAEVLTADHLAVAYGGHLHVLDDGSVVLDDPNQHRHN